MIPDRREQVLALYRRVFGDEKPTAAEPPRRPPAGELPESDAELLRKAMAAQNGAEFTRLWNGDRSGHANDDSKADWALAKMLLFWTGGDVARADTLFRQSGLHRPKWDERRGAETYGTQTLRKRRAGMTEFYRPPQSPGGVTPPPAPSAAPPAGGRKPTGPDRFEDAVPISQLQSSDEEKDAICDGIFYHNATTLLSALPKVGKTTFLAHLLKAACHGGEHCGQKVEPRKVLLVSEEHESRWAKRRDALGLTDNVYVRARPFRTKPTSAG
jgi:AAA domain